MECISWLCKLAPYVLIDPVPDISSSLPHSDVTTLGLAAAYVAAFSMRHWQPTIKVAPLRSDVSDMKAPPTIGHCTTRPFSTCEAAPDVTALRVGAGMCPQLAEQRAL